ncbi:hypothetical protein D3C77_675110 [compost metagenome]
MVQKSSVFIHDERKSAVQLMSADQCLHHAVFLEVDQSCDNAEKLPGRADDRLSDQHHQVARGGRVGLTDKGATLRQGLLDFC